MSNEKQCCGNCGKRFFTSKTNDFRCKELVNTSEDVRILNEYNCLITPSKWEPDLKQN